jgi:hypothetical protein
MVHECRTIVSLRELAATDAKDVGLARASSAALSIIADINQSRLSDGDVTCLSQLVDALSQEGQEKLVAHLEEDAADCRICGVLKQRISGS